MSAGRTAVEGLYEQEAGRVFAYCYARLGSQNLAEWAVGATFDRAREQAANGGLPDQELDWLLRTADKFCSPRLKLGDDSLARDGTLVLRDWSGMTFEEIAADLDGHRARLEAARRELSPWRRLLGALNIAPAGGWLQGLTTGAGAVKATAAAIAVTGAAVVVGTPVGDKLHQAVVPSAKHSTPPSAPAESTPARQDGSTPVSRPVTAATAGGTATTAGQASTPKTRKRPAPGGGGAQPAASPGGQAEASASGGASTAGRSSGIAGSASVSGAQLPEPGKPKPSVTVSPPLPSVPAADTPPLPTPTAPVDTPTVSTPTVSTPTVATPTVPAPDLPPPVTVPGTGATPPVTVSPPKPPALP